MENIVKGDGSEYLDFEEISSKLTSILPRGGNILKKKKKLEAQVSLYRSPDINKSS
jgi:hypothetical protein